MSGEVINYYSRRYVVEVGSDEMFHFTKITEWEFDRAFNTLTDAEAYAADISEYYVHVRVVDRGATRDG